MQLKNCRDKIFHLRCPKIKITRLTLSYDACTAISACKKDVSIAIECP